MRGVGDESRVQLGLRGGAGRLHAPGAEQRSEQRGRVGQGLGAVTGRAVSAGGGSPPHVRTANDGPLQERRLSDHTDNHETDKRTPALSYALQRAQPRSVLFTAAPTT